MPRYPKILMAEDLSTSVDFVLTGKGLQNSANGLYHFDNIRYPIFPNNINGPRFIEIDTIF